MGLDEVVLNQKKDRSVSPVVVRCALHCLAIKVVGSKVRDAMAEHLSPHQSV